MQHEELTNRLLQIKTQITSATNELSEVKGRIKSVKEQIIAKFDVKNVTEANIKLQEMQKELVRMQEQITTEMQSLEDAYQWE